MSKKITLDTTCKREPEYTFGRFNQVGLSKTTPETSRYETNRECGSALYKIPIASPDFIRNIVMRMFTDAIRVEIIKIRILEMLYKFEVLNFIYLLKFFELLNQRLKYRTGIYYL